MLAPLSSLTRFPKKTLLCSLLFFPLLCHPEAPVPEDLLEGKHAPFLLLNPQEIHELKERIQSEPAAKRTYGQLLQKAEDFLARPQRFPELEGGWSHNFVCPKCSCKLSYRQESPRLHLCKECKKEWQSNKLAQAWNAISFGRVSSQMELLGAVALLSNEPRFASALKEAWLDLARKYPNYRPHEKDMKFRAEPLSTAGRATSQSIEENDMLSKLAYSWDALLATQTLSEAERELIENNVWKVANPYCHRVLDLHGSGGNWWVWHNTGALAVGIVTRDLKLIDKALNMPKSGIVAMLEADYVREDGLVDERSAGYQAYAMLALSRMAHLSSRVGLALHKHPRIQAAYTGMTQLLLPDLSLPCMNDGGGVHFRNSSSLERFPDILDQGWSIYRSPGILQTIGILQNSPAFAKNREERLYALLYGPARLQAAKMELPSVAMPASGIALLRSPDKDWTLLLKNNPVPRGHAHPNALHISMFANGEEFIPSFGTPGYGSPYYRGWYSRTLAANTVAVNMACQSMGAIDNRLEWALVRGPVQAAFGSSRKIQVPEDQGPALEANRLVLLTPLAMYEILRVRPDEQLAKNSGLSVNELEVSSHFKGQLALQSEPADPPWKLPSIESLQSASEKSGRIRDPFAAYRLLEQPERVLHKKGVLRGELAQPDGGKVALAFFPAVEGESFWRFMAPGYHDRPTKRLPMLMRRIRSNRARFGSVSVPFTGSNPLRKVTLSVDTATATVIELETDSGSETVFQQSVDGELALSGDQQEFNGSLGVITVAKSCRIYTLKGRVLADAFGKLSAEGPAMLQMKLEGDKPLFTNLGQQTVNAQWQPAGGQPLKIQLQPETTTHETVQNVHR